MKAILLGAALLVLLVAATIAFRRRTPTPTEQEDIQLGMTELSDEAVTMAKTDSNIALDYSLESVEQVEAILASVYANHPDLERRRYLAVRYGAYVGEVIRRKWGGSWDRDHPVGGKDSFPIRSKGHESFPIAWCFKRLKNGSEDNVWHKLQILYVQEQAGSQASTETDQR